MSVYVDPLAVWEGKMLLAVSGSKRAAICTLILLMNYTQWQKISVLNVNGFKMEDYNITISLQQNALKR